MTEGSVSMTEGSARMTKGSVIATLSSLAAVEMAAGRTSFARVSPADVYRVLQEPQQHRPVLRERNSVRVCNALLTESSNYFLQFI